MAQLIWTLPASGPNTTITLTSGVDVGVVTFKAETVGGIPPDRYEIWLGALPAGIDSIYMPGDTQFDITGTPQTVAEISNNRIILRAYYQDPETGANSYIDGTFNFTVQPTAAYPIFTTAAGNIANISTGVGPADPTNNTQVSINYQEIAAPNDVTVRLAAGSLPPGLDIDYAALGGMISSQQIGTNLEIPILGTAFYPRGYANAASQDFYANSYIKPWEFTLEVEDLARANTANFRINVYAREFLNASADGGNVANVIYANLRPQIAWITADSDKGMPGEPQWPPSYYTGNTFPEDFRFGADSSSRYAPWLSLSPGTIGRAVANNFYARELPVESPEPDAEPRFYLQRSNPDDGSPSLLPLGTQLDPITGYIWGRPRVIRDSEFKFTISTEDGAYPGYPGRAVTYNLLVSAESVAGVSWLVPSYLGEISNGDASEFYVAAETPLDPELWYQLTSGSMPPGLTLLENGLIVGRVLFDSIPGQQYTDYAFAITVRGTQSSVAVLRQFTIRVRYTNTTPYNNIYIQCYPDRAQRSVIESILQDYSRIEPSQIYRLGDPNFGLNRDLRFLHALNLRVATDSRYAQAMSFNHYRKRVGVGPFRVARARNPNGTLRYEVIYCEILDPLTNPEGDSESSRITLTYPAEYDGEQYTTIYPNTLEAMRQRLYNTVGQVKDTLPAWMATVQDDKTVLGYTPAWVVVYLKPGYGDTVAFQLNQAWGSYLPNIDFDIDRYVLDNALTYRYSALTGNNYSILAAENLHSPVTAISGNILTLDIDYLSTAQTLKVGDTVSWMSTNSISETAMVVTATVYSPVVGQRGDDPNQAISMPELTVTFPGQGYDSRRPPAVLFSLPELPEGRPAQATATVNPAGQIDSIVLTESGMGYHRVPRITVDLPDDGNAANRASAVANIWLGPVFGYSILNGGQGYANVVREGITLGNVTFSVSAPLQDPLNPTSNVQQNTAKIDYCTLDARGNIIDLTVLPGSYGQYYTTPPFVTVSPPPDLSRANTAVIRSSIRYQILVGNSSAWRSGSNVYLFNQRAATDELDKYYLFPQVNILQ